MPGLMQGGVVTLLGRASCGFLPKRREGVEKGMYRDKCVPGVESSGYAYGCPGASLKKRQGHLLSMRGQAVLRG